MEVSYGIREPDNSFEPCDTMEIALAMKEPDDSIWVCADGTPLEPLPDSFNRLVITEDGRRINSAVLGPVHSVGQRELVPLEGEEDKSPLPTEAPLLIIDHSAEVVMLVTPPKEETR